MVPLCSLQVRSSSHSHHTHSVFECAVLDEHRKFLSFKVQSGRLTEVEFNGPKATAPTDVKSERRRKSISTSKALLKQFFCGTSGSKTCNKSNTRTYVCPLNADIFKKVFGRDNFLNSESGCTRKGLALEGNISRYSKLSGIIPDRYDHASRSLSYCVCHPQLF